MTAFQTGKDHGKRGTQLVGSCSHKGKLLFPALFNGGKEFSGEEKGKQEEQSHGEGVDQQEKKALFPDLFFKTGQRRKDHDLKL